MRAKAKACRGAIGHVALAMFCERGYHSTTLGDIGAGVGVTRGAVLHHFASKAELLRSVVQPFDAALTGLLDVAHAGDPPTIDDQRRLLTALVGLFLEHRQAVQLLVTDVGARIELDQLAVSAARADRLVELLQGSRPGGLARLRILAALGAVVQPVAFFSAELDAVSVGRELVEGALAVLDRSSTCSIDVIDTVARLPRAAADLSFASTRGAE